METSARFFALVADHPNPALRSLGCYAVVSPTQHKLLLKIAALCCVIRRRRIVRVVAGFVRMLA
jgi:hypothetical protein